MSNGELVIGFNFKYFSYLCLYNLTFVLSASLISGRLFPPRPRPLPVPRPPLLAGKIPKKEREKNPSKYNEIYFCHNTGSHCAFSSNLFHGQITQKHIDQMSSPENKKCSPVKVFGINHPQTPRLMSMRGPRCLDKRLSQHYIGPKITFCHF